MIKVIDHGKEYYYNSAAEVREDYPDAEIHNGVAKIN